MEEVAGLSVRAENQGVQRHRPAQKDRPVRRRKQDTKGKGPGTASRAKREQKRAGGPQDLGQHLPFNLLGSALSVLRMSFLSFMFFH